MMKRLNNAIVFIILVVNTAMLFGCGKLTKKENDMKIDGCIIVNDISFEGKEELFKIIEKSKKIYYESESTVDYGKQYTYDVMPYVFPILSQWIDNKKYKVISEQQFTATLQDVFQIDLARKCDKIQIHTEYLEYLTYETSDGEGGMISSGSFTFSSKYKLFFRPIFNEDFVEEIGRTERYMSCFNENTFHYNNFLFHGSNSSLTWLINNDTEFLEILVREFGYDKNDKINRKIIRENYKRYEEANDRTKYHTQQIKAKRANVIRDLFTSKNCYGELDIREELMQSIVDMTTIDDNKYMKWLSDDYGAFLAGVIRGEFEDDKNLFSSFTMEEKVKILAYTCYYVEQAYIKNGVDFKNHDAQPVWLLRSLLSFELKSTPQLLEQLKKHNYYDLPNYRKIVEDHLQLAENLGWG